MIAKLTGYKTTLLDLYAFYVQCFDSEESIPEIERFHSFSDENNEIYYSIHENTSTKEFITGVAVLRDEHYDDQPDTVYPIKYLNITAYENDFEGILNDILGTIRENHSENGICLVVVCKSEFDNNVFDKVGFKQFYNDSEYAHKYLEVLPNEASV